MVGFPGQDGDIRVSWTHVLSQTHHIDSCIWAIFFWKEKKKNLKTVWVTPTHLAEERSLWKQVEDAGLPSHQILHTREGMWNPEHLLKGLELRIRYLQILRTVPEAWAPQTSSFKNQQSLRPQDPPGYKDLRNHAERAWALGLTCCRVQGGSSKSSDRGTLWERFIDWSWILSLMGSRLTWKMFGGLYSPWDENCKGPFFLPFFSSLVSVTLTSPSALLQLAASARQKPFWFPGFCSWDPGDTSDSLALVALGIWTGGPIRLCIFAYFQSCCLGGSGFQFAWISVLPRFLYLGHPCIGKPSITRNHYK